MKTLLTIIAALALILGKATAQSPSKDPEYARLVEAAFTALQKGDCKTCIDQYDSAFQISRHSSLSQLRAAICALHCGYLEQADQLSERAVLINWSVSEKVLQEPENYPEFGSIAGTKFGKDIYERIHAQAEASGIDLELRDVLKEIHQEDQKFRANPNPYAPGTAEFQAYLEAFILSDSLNMVKIEAIIQQFGYPGKSKVGEIEGSTAWLVIQHSPIEKQEQYFPMIEEASQKGELPKSNWALLLDRIQMRRGEKQVYGSQVVRDPSNGQWMLHPIEDETTVNKLRAEIGLEPLEDYALRFGIVWKQK